MRTDSRFPRLHIVDHPLIEHKLSLMRDKNTGTQDFRTLLHEIALLMGYEVTRDFPTKLEDIETPICATKSPMLVEKDPVIVPVLRAGLGMTDGLLALLPAARVGHIGVYRNAQHEPVEYLVRLPDAPNSNYIVVDPMIATGHSAAYAIEILKRRGVRGEQIHFMALVAAPEGIKVLSEAHPDIDIFVAALDEKLNDRAWPRRRRRPNLRHPLTRRLNTSGRLDIRPSFFARHFHDFFDHNFYGFTLEYCYL